MATASRVMNEGRIQRATRPTTLHRPTTVRALNRPGRAVDATCSLAAPRPRDRPRSNAASDRSRAAARCARGDRVAAAAAGEVINDETAPSRGGSAARPPRREISTSCSATAPPCSRSCPRTTTNDRRADRHRLGSIPDVSPRAAGASDRGISARAATALAIGRPRRSSSADAAGGAARDPLGRTAEAGCS